MIVECFKVILVLIFIVFLRKEWCCFVYGGIWVVVKNLMGLILFKLMICKDILIDSFIEKVWESMIIFCECMYFMLKLYCVCLYLLRKYIFDFLKIYLKIKV